MPGNPICRNTLDRTDRGAWVEGGIEGEGAGETEAVKEDDFLYEFVHAEGVRNSDQRIDRRAGPFIRSSM